jgi:hypothetical protein
MIEELLAHDLPIVHRVERYLAELHSPPGWLGRDVVGVLNRELVVADERAIDLGRVQL